MLASQGQPSPGAQPDNEDASAHRVATRPPCLKLFPSIARPEAAARHGNAPVAVEVRKGLRKDQLGARSSVASVRVCPHVGPRISGRAPERSLRGAEPRLRRRAETRRGEQE